MNSSIIVLMVGFGVGMLLAIVLSVVFITADKMTNRIVDEGHTDDKVV